MGTKSKEVETPERIADLIRQLKSALAQCHELLEETEQAARPTKQDNDRK